MPSTGPRDSAKKAIAAIQARIGRQVDDPVDGGGIEHLFVGLQDFLDVAPHQALISLNSPCRMQPELAKR